MAGKKEQVVALIDPELLTQLDILRIITRDSRARVLEDVLRDALGAAVRAERKEERRVRALAKAAGLTLEEYVTAYAKAHSRGGYGPGLDALETDDRVVRKAAAEIAELALSA